MQAFNKQPIRELTPAEDYLLDEKGDNYEHGSGWSEDYQDPSKFWGHGMSHVYCNRNVAFRLKEEKWHGLTSMIIKPNHIEVLINKTPFSKPELKQALIEVWFGSLCTSLFNFGNFIFGKSEESTLLSLGNFNSTCLGNSGIYLSIILENSFFIFANVNLSLF